MAVALSRDIPITEYAPLKIKMAITGNGQASKEQVADMLQRMLHFPKKRCLPYGCDGRFGGSLLSIFCKWDVRQWKKDIAVERFYCEKSR